MKSNYHTHTSRCHHAYGSEEEYIRCAIDRGLNTLGFSDHSPYFFPGDYYSKFRMRPEELDGYVQTLTALREKYRRKIQLHIGLETEYYPAYWKELMSFLRDHPVEYLILGQHFAGNEPHCLYSGNATDDADVLKQYCRMLMDGMQTGVYTYIAHPDLINYVGSARIYREHMGEVIREAKSCGIPLEINLLGIAEQRQYPCRKFLEMAAQENLPMILGIDAHRPEAIADTETENAALHLAEEFSIPIIELAEPKHFL